MRIRTITQAFREIKTADPDTAVTEYAIRQAVVSGEVPSKKAGTKYLVDLDALTKYFTGGHNSRWEENEMQDRRIF